MLCSAAGLLGSCQPLSSIDIALISLFTFLYRDQLAYLEKLGCPEALVKRYNNVSDYSAAKISFENHWGDEIPVRDHLLTTDKANIPVVMSEHRDVINGNPNAII